MHFVRIAPGPPAYAVRVVARRHRPVLNYSTNTRYGLAGCSNECGKLFIFFTGICITVEPSRVNQNGGAPLTVLSGPSTNATGERAACSGLPAAAERAIGGWHFGDCDRKRLRSRVEYVPICEANCRRRRGLIDQGPAPAALIRGSSMHRRHLFGASQCLS